MRPRLLNPRDAYIAHRDAQLVLQDVDQVLDALLPVARRIQETPPDAHGRRAEAQTLEDVGAAPDAAVDVDLEPLLPSEHLGKAPVALE